MDGVDNTRDPPAQDDSKVAEEKRNPFLETPAELLDPTKREEDPVETKQVEEPIQTNPFEDKDPTLRASRTEDFFYSTGIRSHEDESWDANARNDLMGDEEEQKLVEVYLSRRQLSFCIANDSISEDQVQRFESREPTAREAFLLSPEQAIVVLQGQDLPDVEENLSSAVDTEFYLDNERTQDRRRLTLDVELKGLEFNSADTERNTLSSRNQILEDEVVGSTSEDVSQENKSESSQSDRERTPPPKELAEKYIDVVKPEPENEKLNYLAMFEEELEKQKSPKIEAQSIASHAPPRLEVQAYLPAEDIIEQFDVLSPHNPRKVALLKENQQFEDLNILAELKASESNSTSTNIFPRVSKTEEKTSLAINDKQIDSEKWVIPEPPTPKRSKRQELEKRLHKINQLKDGNCDASGNSRALQRLANAISANDTLMDILFERKQTEVRSTNKLVEESPLPNSSVFNVIVKDFAKPPNNQPAVSVSDKSFDILKNVTNKDQSQETLSALEIITNTIDALDESKGDKSQEIDMKLERYRANCMELIYYMIKKKLRRLEEIQQIEVCKGLTIIPEERQMKIIQKQTDETERELNKLREKLLSENWWLEQIPNNNIESQNHEPSLDPKRLNQVFEPIASTFNSILTLDDQARELFTQKLEGLKSAIETKNIELQGAFKQISELKNTNLDEKAELEAQVFDLKSKLLELRGESHGMTKGFRDTTRQLSKPEVEIESTISKFSNSNPFNEDDEGIRAQLSEQIIEVQRQQMVTQELRERLSELLRTVSEVQKQHPEIKLRELIPGDTDSLAYLVSFEVGSCNRSKDTPFTVNDTFDTAQLGNEAIASSPKSYVSSSPRDETKYVLENPNEMSESPKTSAPSSSKGDLTEGRIIQGHPQGTDDFDPLNMQQDEDKPAEEEESSDVEEETQIGDSQLEELRSTLQDVQTSKIRLIETTSTEINFLRKQIEELRLDLNTVRMWKLKQKKKGVSQETSWLSSWWTQKPEPSRTNLSQETIGFSDRWKDKSDQVLTFSSEIERLRDIIRVLSTKNGHGDVTSQLQHDFIDNVPVRGLDKYERNIVDYTVDLP